VAFPFPTLEIGIEGNEGLLHEFHKAIVTYQLGKGPPQVGSNITQK
jgi:hypothetical protein